MKKGANDDLSKALAVDYSQNLLQNLAPSPEFQILAKSNRELIEDKTLLNQITNEEILKDDFDIFSCVGIDPDNNTEHAKIFGYKSGLFNNLQITNIFTPNDSKALKKLFHCFQRHELWKMAQVQKTPKSPTKKLRFVIIIIFI